MQKSLMLIRSTRARYNALFLLAITLLLPTIAKADPPLDLAATGTTVAGYIAAAAGAGVGILAAMYGVKVIIRAFKAVK